MQLATKGEHLGGQEEVISAKKARGQESRAVLAINKYGLSASPLRLKVVDLACVSRSLGCCCCCRSLLCTSWLTYLSDETVKRFVLVGTIDALVGQTYVLDLICFRSVPIIIMRFLS